MLVYASSVADPNLLSSASGSLLSFEYSGKGGYACCLAFEPDSRICIHRVPDYEAFHDDLRTLDAQKQNFPWSASVHPDLNHFGSSFEGSSVHQTDQDS